MSTIKQDRNVLEQMLNGITAEPKPLNGVPQQSVQQKVSNSIDNQSGGTFGVETSFTFDYDATKKMLRKKARKTVINIIKHIMPESMVNDPYVNDKLEQDTDILTDLYMQLECNNVMHRSILETVSRGNTLPRLYEVFGQLSDKIQALDKQIMAAEQSIRKTYLDLKYEITERQAELPQTSSNLIEQGTPEIVSSSRQLIEAAKKKHRAAVMTMEEDDDGAEYEEV